MLLILYLDLVGDYDDMTCVPMLKCVPTGELFSFLYAHASKLLQLKSKVLNGNTFVCFMALWLLARSLINNCNLWPHNTHSY